MKRFIFLFVAFCSMFTGALSMFAQQTDLDLVAERIKKEPMGNDYPRSPVNIPSASIDDHTLYLCEGHPDYVLQLVDPEDEDIIVYEVLIPANVNSIVLPSSLIGEYVIQLLWTDWRFWGYIELE
jgi:hypothetical protein